MACYACRQRLLGIFILELIPVSRQHLSRRAGRAIISAKFPRHPLRRGYSSPATTAEPVQDDLSIPFDSPFTPPSSASTNTSQVQTFPTSRPSRLQEDVPPGKSPNETTNGSFEPQLSLESTVAYDREYVGAEQKLSEIPTLGKHARKKLRRAREAAVQAHTNQSEDADTHKVIKHVKTSTDNVGDRAKGTPPNGKQIGRRKRTGTTREKLAVTASRLRQPSRTSSKPKKTLEPWQQQKRGLEEKFGDEHWTPNKKLSPDAMDGIRALHTQYPDKFTTPMLAKHFKMSPDAIRRILKSKWQPTAEEDEKRRERWENRGVRIWTKLAEKGINPPDKWKGMGAGAGFSRTDIERGEAGRQAMRDMNKSDTERRLKRLMAEIPDFR